MYKKVSSVDMLAEFKGFNKLPRIMRSFFSQPLRLPAIKMVLGFIFTDTQK